MAKLYHYVGPTEIRSRVVCASGESIHSLTDLRAWLARCGERADRRGLIGTTFVIDEVGALRIAVRRSEHVACSGGAPILSAGEMFFLVAGEAWEVIEVSNQSTGYCPEAESWPAVEAALDTVGIAHPGRFTESIIFRRCPDCGERNIVKDESFICAVCGGVLPRQWNLA